MNRRSGIDSRKNIVDAALKVFCERGYKGANMRMIASKAGISVGGIYLYFRNKEELYLGLMKERVDDFIHQLQGVAEGAGSCSEALVRCVRAHIGNIKKHKELILAHSRELDFTFGIEVARSFDRKQARIFEGIISKGIRAGEFGECPVREVAKVIRGMLRAYAIATVVDPDSVFSEKACTRLILSGLWARGPRETNQPYQGEPPID
jgi:AcrR family transcriptional regulator